MDPVVLIVGAVILAAVGVWTVTHPNGGYRASGGIGSSFTPSTRRACGYGLLLLALVALAFAASGPA